MNLLDLKKLPKDIHPIVALHQWAVAAFFENARFDLDIEQARLKRKVWGRVKQGLPDMEFLRAMIDAAEEEMKIVASRHSLYTFLFWSRRLAPDNIFGRTPSTVEIYRRVQSLAIYKHAPIQHDNSSAAVSDGQMIPTSLKGFSDALKDGVESPIGSKAFKALSDELADTIRLEILAYLFVYATQLYRWINKGAKLSVDWPNMELRLETGDELNLLVGLYDSRDTDVLSISGSWTPKPKSGNLQYTLVGAHLNVDHKSRVKLIRDGKPENYKDFPTLIKGDSFTPNFLLSTLDMSRAYDLLKDYSVEIVAKYGATPEDIICFLAFLCHIILSQIADSPIRQVEVCNRGYVLLDETEDELKEDYIKFLESVKEEFEHVDKISPDSFDKLLRHFSLTEGNQNDIDLWTRGPIRLIYKIGHGMMALDYSMVDGVVAYLAKEFVRTGGEKGNPRGERFESDLRDVCARVFGEKRLWVCHGKVRSTLGEKEIDASVAYNDTLYLFEAKAVNVSFAYDMGEAKALDYRKKQIVERSLREAEEKTDFIIRSGNELNPPLPKGVKYILPVGISPFPEYIHSYDDKYFCDAGKTLPRVLTPDEIGKLKKIPLRELLNRKKV